MTQAINIYWQKLTDLKSAFNKLLILINLAWPGGHNKRIFKEILQAKQVGLQRNKFWKILFLSHSLKSIGLCLIRHIV